MGGESNLILSAWLRESTASMKLPAAGTRRAATTLSEPRDFHQAPLLPGSDSRGLRHRWPLLGTGFYRSCHILPDVPAQEGKRSVPIALEAAWGWVKCAGRSVRSSASHRRRRRRWWRWLRVPASLRTACGRRCPRVASRRRNPEREMRSCWGEKNGDREAEVRDEVQKGNRGCV